MLRFIGHSPDFPLAREGHRAPSTLLKQAIFTSVCILCASCASYHAHPIALEETQAQFAHRTLSDPKLNEFVTRIAKRDATDREQNGWTPAELLIAATQWNPSLRESQAKLRAASAAVKTARALPNPTLALTNEYDLSRAEESPWLWGFAVDFLLEGPLRRKIRTQVADAAVRSARLDYTETLWSLRRDLRAAIIAYIIADKRIAVLDAARADRESLAQLSARRVAVGETAATDRVQAELELSRTRTALAQARQQKQDASSKLAATLSVPLAAIEHLQIRFDDFDLPSVDFTRLDELRTRALLSRTDLEMALIDYQTRELELRREIHNQYPTFTLGPGFTYDHGVRKATLGASLSLPIFNRNQGPIAEAEARRELAEKHLLSVQAQIFGEIDSARTSLQMNLDALAIARQQSDEAQRLIAQVEREVRVGSTDRPALLAAQLNASADQLAALDAEERALTALAQLEDALRTPLSGSELALDLQPENP